jgi:hypothetical protein
LPILTILKQEMKLRLTIGLLFLCFGCFKDKQSRNKIEIFEKFKTSVSDRIFLNFPLNKNEVSSSFYQRAIFPEAMYASGFSGIFISNKYEKEKFDEKIELLSKIKIFEAQLKDSCNIKITASDTLKKIFCRDGYFPIPPIEDNYYVGKSFNPFSSLLIDPEDLVLVLAAEPGIFFVKKNPGESNQLNFESIDLAGRWKDGFSSGVIINMKNQMITYWVMIW